jgi:hypothetical protein
LGSALLPFGDIYANGTVSLPSTTSIGDVSAIEISYVNNVTSAIQTQLNNKADTAGAIDIEEFLLFDAATDTLATKAEVRAGGSGTGDISLSDTTHLYTFNTGYNTAHDTVFFAAGSILGAYHTRGRDTTVITHVISQISDGDSLTFHILYADTINAVVPTHVTDTIVLNDNGTVETITFECDTIPPDKWVYAKAIATPDGKNPIFFTSTMVGHKVKGTSVKSTLLELCEEYQEVYDLMTIKPTGNYLAWQNAMVKRLDDSAYWDRIKLVYFFAVQDSTSAKLEWTNPGTHTLTNVVGTGRTFTAWQGYNGHNTSAFSTGWNPSTDSTGVGNNNITLASWQLAEVNAVDVVAGVSITASGRGLRLYPRYSDLLQARIISSATNELGNGGTSVGFTLATRTDHNVIDGYLNPTNSTPLGTDTDESNGLPAGEVYILSLNNDGSAAQFFDGIVSMILVMDKVTGEEAHEIFDIIDEEYMTKIGL